MLIVIAWNNVSQTVLHAGWLQSVSDDTWPHCFILLPESLHSSYVQS